MATLREALRELIRTGEALPIDSIICYASTIVEYEPNRMAKEFSDAMAAARAALEAAEPVPDVWNRLYQATNEMMAYLGAHGEITARGDRAQAVMDALYAIDGGVVRPVAPAEGAALDAKRYLTKREIDWQAASRKHPALIANKVAWLLSYDAAIDAAMSTQTEASPSRG